MISKKFKKKLLVIDDDQTFCLMVKDSLSSVDLQVFTAQNMKDGLFYCTQNRMDIVLLDQKLPDGEGHSLCPLILKHNDQTKIIFITAYPSFNNALEAIKGGAYDYMSKPFELAELRMAIDKALLNLCLEKIKQFHGYQTKKNKEENLVVGKFGGHIDIHQFINLSAANDVPVLITGETGTGKNVVAKAIHYMSKKCDAPFLSVNCASLSETMIEAELFGHEKGAFTGATSGRKGVFELAENGTLFLDEIGAMSTTLQSKLLGVLDEGKIKRIGGQSLLEVNPRILAATNVDLQKHLKEGSFRKDLYYRLCVLKIELPPLRHRVDDIPELCRFFIKKFAGNKNTRISDIEIQNLMKYHWPGNLRELKNIIERSIILHRNHLSPSQLLEGIEFSSSRVSPYPYDDDIQSIQQIESVHIKKVVTHFLRNYSKSARALGISLSTLKRKLKEMGFGNDSK